MIDTREIASEYRLAHWAGMIKERAESGLTVKAFCESAGVHPNSYFYWQRKLREAACAKMPEAVTSPTPCGWTAAIPAVANVSGTLPIEIGKCRVMADCGTDERLLAKVCRVLVSL
jgi:putative transposase